MEIDSHKIPKRLWLTLLSYLDGKSLRNSLLVSRQWYELGKDASLNHLSNRYLIERITKLRQLDTFQTVKYLATTNLKNLDRLATTTKEEGQEWMLKRMLRYVWILKFIPILLHLLVNQRCALFILFINLIACSITCLVRKISSAVVVLLFVCHPVLGIVEGMMLGRYFGDKTAGYLGYSFYFYQIFLCAFSSRLFALFIHIIKKTTDSSNGFTVNFLVNYFAISTFFSLIISAYTFTFYLNLKSSLYSLGFLFCVSVLISWKDKKNRIQIAVPVTSYLFAVVVTRMILEGIFHLFRKYNWFVGVLDLNYFSRESVSYLLLRFIQCFVFSFLALSFNLLEFFFPLFYSWKNGEMLSVWTKATKITFETIPYLLVVYILTFLIK